MMQTETRTFELTDHEVGVIRSALGLGVAVWEKAAAEDKRISTSAMTRMLARDAADLFENKFRSE